MPIYTCPHCKCQTDARAMQRQKSKVAYRSHPLGPPRVPDARGRIWQCMRQMRTFTQPDLVATAETSQGNVSRLVTTLVALGYVRVEKQANGLPGSYRVFRLLNDTGPHAPRIRRQGHVIWDVNLQQEVRRD